MRSDPQLSLELPPDPPAGDFVLHHASAKREGKSGGHSRPHHRKNLQKSDDHGWACSFVKPAPLTL
jgi:hypothetical protein